MARTDAIVLGAGIVGTSVALHLAKHGLSVALVDRSSPGEQTSFGNAGITLQFNLDRDIDAAAEDVAAADGDRRRRTEGRGPEIGDVRR